MSDAAPPELDRAKVEGLAEKLLELLNAHYRAGPKHRDRALEALNAIAHVIAVTIAGAGFDPAAFAFFRLALAADLRAMSVLPEAVAARVDGRSVMPPWLTDRPPHIAIDEAIFRLLVGGKAVEIHDQLSAEHVRVILSDIGFDRMHQAIEDAERVGQ